MYMYKKKVILTKEMVKNLNEILIQTGYLSTLFEMYAICLYLMSASSVENDLDKRQQLQLLLINRRCNKSILEIL